MTCSTIAWVAEPTIVAVRSPTARPLTRASTPNVGDILLFSIRDKVYYENDDERDAAEKLQQRNGELIKAFGLPAVFEFKRKRYLQMKLNRSTSGAALNLARIPSFTAELGAPQMIVPAVVQTAVNGLHNCLVHVGMLDEAPRPVNAPQIESDIPLRRESHPRAPESGLLRHHVKAGQMVNKGDVIATLLSAPPLLHT